MSERLQKLLAAAGYGSRRACEALILQGRVTVNGRPAEIGQKADPAVERIVVDGEPLSAAEQLTYIALHKPAGVVSSREPQGPRETVLDLVPSTVRLYPVGRLDLDSEGLTLLTNDGDLANHLTHPSQNVEKEYRVLVKGHPDEDQLDAWRRGIILTDRETGERRKTRPAKVWRDDAPGPTTWLRVVMQEGRKHEIREIGSTLNIPVLRLIRVRIGSLELGDLRTGEWRSLDEREVRALRGPSSSPRRSGSTAQRPASSARKSTSGRKGPRTASGPRTAGGSRTASRKPGTASTSRRAPDGRRPAPAPARKTRMKSKKKPQ